MFTECDRKKNCAAIELFINFVDFRINKPDKYTLAL